MPRCVPRVGWAARSPLQPRPESSRKRGAEWDQARAVRRRLAPGPPRLVRQRRLPGRGPDPADGTELFTGSNGTRPVRFSPDGQYLVTLDDTTGDTGASDAAAPVMVDTTDGSSWRLVASATGASVGWATDTP